MQAGSKSLQCIASGLLPWLRGETLEKQEFTEKTVCDMLLKGQEASKGSCDVVEI